MRSDDDEDDEEEYDDENEEEEVCHGHLITDVVAHFGSRTRGM